MCSSEKKDNIWIYSAVILFIAYVIKVFSPHLTAWMFRMHPQWLNRLLFLSEQHSIPYYQGRLEDLIFGPLFVLLTGLLFLYIGRRKLRHVNLYTFTAAVFVYFLLTRGEVLFYPPYGENMAGPLAPALWLKRHGFNFPGLLQQKTFAQGGPNIYVTSLFPWLEAVFMALSPTGKVFVFLNHLMDFVLASFIVAFFRDILKKFFDPDVAVSGAVLLVSLPIMQTMVEMINMEMPCAFFAMLSVYFLVQHKIDRASVAAIFSLLFKAPGGIVCLTVFIIACLLLWGDDSRRDKVKNLIWGMIALLFAVAKAVTRKILMGDQPTNNKVEFMSGWPYMSGMSVFWVMSALVLIGSAHFIYVWRRDSESGKRFAYLLRRKVFLIMLMMGCFWFLLYLNYSVMGFRYEVLLDPFYVFFLVYVLCAFLKNARWRSLVFGGLITFYLFCSYGLFFDRSTESSVYSYHKFERSLEYRNDLKMHMKAAREIEANYSGHLVAAPFVVAHALGVPEFGYVNKKLDVMVYGMWLSYGDFKNFSGLKGLDLYNTIWLGFYKSHFPIELPYPMDAQDKFIKDVEEGNKRMALFKGGFAIEKMRIIAELASRGKLQEVLKK